MSLIKDRGRATARTREQPYATDEDTFDSEADCLAFRKVLSSGSPGKTVWIALEEAAKHHRQKQLKKKESQATTTPSHKKPAFINQKRDLPRCSGCGRSHNSTFFVSKRGKKLFHERSPLKKKKTRFDTSYTGSAWLLACGSVLIGGAILTLIWTPFEILLQERLRMTRGLPPYEWWAVPPDTVHFYAYVFNVTNHEEFLNGLEPKLKLQELGPYTFRENVIHGNIHFNPNGTLTYTSIRRAEFAPELNHLSLNDTIIVPNIPYLAMASQLSQSSFFMRVGFNMLVNRAQTQPFVRKTVEEYFWNFTDPLIELALNLVPSMVPTNNTGVLHTVYQNFEDVVTMRVGTENGDFNFFKIDKWNGQPGLGHWENRTCDSVQGATEGVSYHQRVKKDDTLWYLRKTICRAIPLYYKEDTEVHGMEAYRFVLLNDTWSRPTNPEDECYWNKRYPLLPNGLSDISPCYFGMPLASSFPHFYSGDPVLTEKIDGLEPDWAKHGSEVIVEPNTGLPFTEWARSQCNLVMRKMSSFPKLLRLTDVALPLFWLEYRVLHLPDKIIHLLVLTVKVIKPYQTHMSVIALFIGALLWAVALKRLRTRDSVKPTQMGYNSVQTVFKPSEMTA